MRPTQVNQATKASAQKQPRHCSMATKAWWDSVVQPPTRDVDGEIDMIIARILVMPPPNSLMTESTAYLRQMQRLLTLLNQSGLKTETLPPPVRSLMANLSAELFARHLAGTEDNDQPSN